MNFRMPVIPVQGRAHSPPLPPWERLPLPKFADSREYKGKSGYPRAAALRCRPALFRAGGEKRGKKRKMGKKRDERAWKGGKRGRKMSWREREEEIGPGCGKWGCPGGPPRPGLLSRGERGKGKTSPGDAVGLLSVPFIGAFYRCLLQTPRVGLLLPPPPRSRRDRAQGEALRISPFLPPFRFFPGREESEGLISFYFLLGAEIRP